MHTITASLANASSRWGQRPRVTLDVLDERPRWKSIRSGTATANIASAWLNSACLLRARVTADGLSISREADPVGHAESGWAGWTVQHTIPWSGSEVGMAVVGNEASSTNVRVFFMKPRGSLGDMHVSESADGFGTPVATSIEIHTNHTLEAFLAGANENFFYCANNSEILCWHKPWSSGAWTARSPCTTLGVVTACQGLGACWDHVGQRAYIIVAHDGAISVTSYTPASDTWGSLYKLAPGMEATAGSASSYRLCAVILANDRIIASWVEATSGNGWYGVLRTQAVVSEGLVYPHFGNQVALELYGGNDLGRPNLAYNPTTCQLLAHDEGSACLRTLLDAEEPAAQHAASGLPVAAYDLHTTPAGSALTIRLLNADGRYNAFGQSGDALEVIKPLASLHLNRGYETALGTEALALPTHYLVKASLQAGMGARCLMLEAVDGLGLLARWHAVESHIWNGRSIRWLLQELCAIVGLTYSDNGASIPSTVLPEFSLHSGSSSLAGVQQLLFLSASVGFCRAEGLYVLPVADMTSTDPAELGQNGEIRRAVYGMVTPELTGLRVYGTAADGRREDVAASMALGMRYQRVLADARTTDDTWALAVAEGGLAEIAPDERRDEVTVPLRPELELYDPVALYHTGVLAEGSTRRILGISESYRPTEGRFESTLELG
ncbi:MAG: hypothetical protein ACYCZF_03745 [Anaerolineae bacterium]